ncbi:MAG: 4-hydroxythreonine-4-phosphate dehydrogenase PdxA [Vampirovibrionales bacterium]|nr:4-hydroxythreonine-4-phosphate dehydrogenase PdxA [Vampirovibrionales bacterium]
MAKQLPPKQLPLCLTPGDPTGIGPEITLKFLSHYKVDADKGFCPIVVIGSKQALLDQAQALGMALPESPEITYIDIVEAMPGKTAYQALVRSVELIAGKKAKGLVSGPISKANLHQAGLSYGGHTEILQDLANTHFPMPTAGGRYQADMLFVYRQFRMLLLTRHIALRDVSSHLNPDNITRALNSLLFFLKHQARIETPRLGILGVNPHAGEMQQQQEFCEERDILVPVLKKLSAQWQMPIDPPLPADAAFRGFLPDNPPYDCYVAPYHDQGLIPMKLVAGMHAVNVTIGLPFLRTSVSHGTAPDIAGKGIADASALEAAFDLACQLT